TADISRWPRSGRSDANDAEAKADRTTSATLRSLVSYDGFVSQIAKFAGTVFTEGSAFQPASVSIKTRALPGPAPAINTQEHFRRAGRNEIPALMLVDEEPFIFTII